MLGTGLGTLRMPGLGSALPYVPNPSFQSSTAFLFRFLAMRGSNPGPLCALRKCSIEPQPPSARLSFTLGQHFLLS